MYQRLATCWTFAIVAACVTRCREIIYVGLTHVNRFFKQPTYGLFGILLYNKQIKRGLFRSDATVKPMFKQPNHPLFAQFVIIFHNICFLTTRTSYSWCLKDPLVLFWTTLMF